MVHCLMTHYLSQLPYWMAHRFVSNIHKTLDNLLFIVLVVLPLLVHAWRQHRRCWGVAWAWHFIYVACMLNSASCLQIMWLPLQQDVNDCEHATIKLSTGLQLSSPCTESWSPIAINMKDWAASWESLWVLWDISWFTIEARVRSYGALWLESI